MSSPAATPGRPPSVLLVVSATRAVPGAPGAPRPRKDYDELARALGATVLEYGAIGASPVARAIARVAGRAAAQAWLAFRQRSRCEVIVTDGEHIGIPLAVLLKLARSRTTHVTIGHRIAAAKKRPFFRLLGVHSHMQRIVLHARGQMDLAVREARIPAERLAFVPYQVDPDFWCPQPEVAEERLIASAGLEHRDYPTLFRAVEGLDAQVVVGAASYWSKQRNTAADVSLPPNVEVGAFDYVALRSVYARAAIVVVPLDDVDFQAGVTTILEAMAMGKPVIVTHTAGQTDVVEDRRTLTRGNPGRPRPVSLLRSIAQAAGADLEPTGFYVPPADPEALRRAIVYLLDHPAERARLGAAGRRTVERLMTVDQYAERIGALVQQAHQAASAPRPDAAAQAAPTLSPGATG